MAKKGGVQQLQTEVNSIEELTKFLERDGLIVLDVYTEWCGPCVAMIGSLKKIKLEQGGDDLHLAVVRCDQIDVFERFRNKSEPTWLLASKGKLVNSAFGSNVPHLIELIIKELDIERRVRDSDPETSGRTYYELNEMTPVECERFAAAEKIRLENERIELESAQRQRSEYLTFVTDEIMKNATDMGVTVLMPHVISRDLLKRLTDPADKCHLVAKDKKTLQITEEHIDVIEFGSTNPMPKYLLDHILNRDVFVVCWKVADSNNAENRLVEDYLNSLVNVVWNEESISSNPGGNGVSLLRSFSVVIETEDDDLMINDSGNGGNDETRPINIKINDEINIKKENDSDRESQNEPPIEDGENTEEDPNSANNEPCDNENEKNIKFIEKTDEKKPNEIDDSKKEQPLTGPKAKNEIKVKIPPIWTPQDRRTNAALIYLYFRNLTESYLPPDPPVEKPHLAMAFDAYKRKEIMDVIDMYRDDILAYGYFTTENPETAQLIANSTFNYHKNPPTIYDKMVVKVAKIPNSPTVATLKNLGPSYVSKNTEEGKRECLIFFPPGFKNSSETGEPTPEPIDEKPKKKKKKRKNKQENIDGSETKTADESNPAQETDAEHEAISEQDNGESRDDDDDENSIDDEEIFDSQEPA